MHRRVLAALTLSVAACSASEDSSLSGGDGGSTPPNDASSADADASTGPSGSCPTPNVSLDDLVAHNTSAFASYDQAHFPANFGPTSWVSQAGATIAIDASTEDMSLNPVTPAHVSNVDVHTLIPSRPDLRWFAHLTPWFKAGGGNHIDIGLDNDTDAYAKAVVDDVRRRGFDGVILDWYGKDSYEDSVTLRIQKYVGTLAPGSFAFIVMMDKGISGLSKDVLETQIAYASSQYFSDPSYEREDGKPIVMFFGVDGALGDSTMTAVKNEVGQSLVFVPQGAGSLASSWVDECFDWTHDYHDGDSSTDPYALAAVSSFYKTVAKSSKKAFGSMVAGFNGTLTMTVAWSKGKYLPRGDGSCVVEWAKTIDAVIPANVTRMQWATWSDWEEGTEIESGVENGARVVASATKSSVTWTVTTAGGDESTVDHYEIYASRDGTLAAKVGEAASGVHAFVIDGSCVNEGDRIEVVAVGKPSIRNHASAAVVVP